MKQLDFKFKLNIIGTFFSKHAKGHAEGTKGPKRKRNEKNRHVGTCKEPLRCRMQPQEALAT